MKLRRVVPATVIGAVAVVTGGLLLTGTGSASAVNKPAATSATAPGPTGIFVWTGATVSASLNFQGEKTTYNGASSAIRH